MRSLTVICGLLGLLTWRSDDVKSLIEVAVQAVTAALL